MGWSQDISIKLSFLNAVAGWWFEPLWKKCSKPPTPGWFSSVPLWKHNKSHSSNQEKCGSSSQMLRFHRMNLPWLRLGRLWYRVVPQSYKLLYDPLSLWLYHVESPINAIKVVLTNLAMDKRNHPAVARWFIPHNTIIFSSNNHHCPIQNCDFPIKPGDFPWNILSFHSFSCFFLLKMANFPWPPHPLSHGRALGFALGRPECHRLPGRSRRPQPIHGARCFRWGKWMVYFMKNLKIKENPNL